MKALTNILTRLLMLLLLMLVACTEDVAEVDNLVRGEEYVQVRMQVPGMKAATTRATAEDNITSVVALVFRDDALISKTEVTTAASTLSPATTTTGSFKIEMPKSGDVIHFLANLPDDIKNKLPETGGSQTDVLRNLETNDRENLSYWGKATYSSGENLDVTLYRNMAKIEIVPGTECTFPEDELFIAGLVNANQKGALVPYDEGFNFDLETSEPTLPAEPNPLDKTDELTNFGSGYDSSYYVFEHDNPETEDGLYVICKIGKYYYKVALIGEDGEPYPIIRNHRYVIYVNDLDEGVADYKAALTADPVNFVVKKIQDVTISPTAAQTMNYGEELSVTVSVPNGSTLNNLAITADGFTIKQGSTTLGTDSYENNSLSYTNTTLTYTFVPTSVGSKSITITGSGDYLNDFEQIIEVSVQKAAVTFQYTDNQIINLNEGYLDVQMNGVPNGSTVTLTITALDFEVSAQNDTQLTHDGDVWTYVGTATNFRFTPTSEGEKNISITGEGENVNVTPAEIRVTVVDSSIKVTSGTINMDNSETSTTLTLTKPTDVQNIRFNIAGANDKFAVSVNGNTLQFDNNNKYFAIQNNSNENVEITFTAQGNVAAGAYTVTFWDANNQEMVTTGIITVVNTPKLQYEYSNNATLYMDSNPQFPVTITVPDGCTLTQLNISAEGFTVTASTEGLSESDGSYTYSGGSTTFTFVPTSAGDKTITFSGSGTNLNVPEKTISVKVEATKPAVTEIVIWEGETKFNWPGDTPYNVSQISQYVGGKLKIDIVATGNGTQIQFFNVPGNNYLFYDNFTSGENRTFEFTIIESSPTEIKINGTGFTLKKIYIIPASTTN